MCKEQVAPPAPKKDITTTLGGVVPLPKGHQDRVTMRINRKWYDVTDFTDHPGGPVALAISAGRDATGLFEAHHFRSTARDMLRRFELTEQEVAKRGLKCDDDAGHFDWDGFSEDPFVKDLRASATNYFSSEAIRRGVSFREATKATPWRWFEIICFFCAFLACIPFLLQGRYWAAPLTGLTAWLYTVNYWHDALHFSLSTNWKLNALLPYLGPWFSSPYTWYHQHVIGHHVHTNVGHRDPDLAHAPQLMREHVSVRHRPAHVHQHVWWHLLFVWGVGVTIGLNMLSDLRAQMGGMYNRAVLYRKLSGARLAAHLFGRAVYLFAVAGWPWLAFSPLKAAFFVVVPCTVYSLLFMVTSQVAHLTPHTAHASDKNFYKHQLRTTQDFAPPVVGASALSRLHSALTFYASGGLSLQVEHHLFPSVNHCHLPALHRRVAEVCKKHGVTLWATSGYASAVRQHIRHTFDMSAPTDMPNKTD